MAGAKLMVQISPDGMHGCDEGTLLVITEDELDFCRVRYSGNWLRLVGMLPEGANLRGMVTPALKE